MRWRRELVRLEPSQVGVEHCVLCLLDRGVRELNRECRVVLFLLGVPLGPIHVVPSPLHIDVFANLCDVLAPRALQVVPPDRELVLVRVGRLAQLLSLGPSRRSRGFDVRLKVGARAVAQMGTLYGSGTLSF